MLVMNRKAQSTLEYAILIGIVVGALLSMQNFLKRSFQGKLQSLGDNLGDPYSPGHTNRVELANSRVERTVETTTPGIANYYSNDLAGKTQTSVTGAIQNTSSNRSLTQLDNETWPTNTK